MKISMIGKKVFLEDEAQFAVNVVNGTIEVWNYEGEGTGGDGGGGVGLRYHDTEMHEQDMAVPNNGSISVNASAIPTPICEIYARPVGGEYEDKLVDIVIKMGNIQYTKTGIHIGDNDSSAVLSYTIDEIPVHPSEIVGIDIDWGDGTAQIGTAILENGVWKSNERWVAIHTDENNNIIGIGLKLQHEYENYGEYPIRICYQVNEDTRIIHTAKITITTSPWNPGDDDDDNPNDDNPNPIPPNPVPPIPPNPNDDDENFTTTPSLKFITETDKEEYSWRVDGNAIINIKVIDNNQIPIDGCLISPPATNLGNGWYQIIYPLPQIDDTVEVEITAQKSGYEPASTTVSLRVSEWGNYILKASVLTDKDKYLYASTEPAKITVTVEDKTGNRVSGCTVTDNFGNSYTDNGNGEYTTDMDISNLPVGRYDLVIKATEDNYKSNINDRTPQTETFVYDGVNASFKLRYKLTEPVSVKINVVETTNYTITNDAYGDCYLNILDSMNASDTVEITYNYYTDSTYFDIAESLESITVIVVDEESIAKYGKRPMETLYIPSLQSVEDAEQIGRDYLAQYANPRPVWEIETYLDLIPPKIGDIVFTNDKFWNIIQKRVNYVEFQIKPNDKRVKLGLEYEKELLIDILESLKG